MATTTQRKIGCALSGVLFAMAWFIYIDGAVLSGDSDELKSYQWYYMFPGLLGSLALLMLNTVPFSLDDDSQYDEEETVSYSLKVRFWFFLAFTIHFCCVAGGIWIFIETYLVDWVGFAIFLNPTLILASSLLLLIIRRAAKGISFELV